MLNTQKTKPKATLIFKNCSRVRIIVYKFTTAVHNTAKNSCGNYGRPME